MSYFLRKSILRHGKLNITASVAHQKLGFLQNNACASTSMLFSSNCSLDNANRHSFSVSYLINSCGLSLESALSASKYVHLKTTRKPDLVLDFFKKHGFSKSQITHIIKRFPRLLLCSPEKTLLPKLEYFRSIGISSGDLAKMFSLRPFLFTRSIEKHTIPNVNSLRNLLQSSEKTVALIKRFPHILFHDVEYYVVPKVKILRDSGVPESNIVKFIYTLPQLFLLDVKNFEKNMAFVKEIGINPLRSQFLVAINVKSGMSKSRWESKLDVYKRWGWSEKEWLAAFAKYPWCMIASVDKIMVTMEFFVKEMGWDSSVIAKHPILVQMSMEKRIIPRVAVIQFLLSKGLIKESANIVTWFKYPEKAFLQRLMNCYDEASQLLELYQGKLNLVNKTKHS